MNKKDLINAISSKTDMTKKDTENWLETFLDVITDALVEGEKVQLSGFGSFETVERAERQSRNPQTGEAITVAACRAPKFKASPNLKSYINE